MGAECSVAESFTPPELEDSENFCAVHISEGSLQILYGGLEVRSIALKHLSTLPTDSVIKADTVKENWYKIDLAAPVFEKRKNVNENILKLKFVCLFLADMSEIGYSVHSSLKLLRKAGNSNFSTLLLSKEPYTNSESEAASLECATKYFCVDLFSTDGLTIVGAPELIIEEADRLVDTYYINGKRNTMKHAETISMVLYDDPWYTGKNSDEEATTSARYMLSQLFRYFLSEGWFPAVSLNLGYNDTIFFRQITGDEEALCSSARESEDSVVLFSCERKNMIRIVAKTRESESKFEEVTRDYWSQYQGVSSVVRLTNASTFTLRLQPWRVHYFDEESMYSKWFVIKLFEEASSSGWWPILRFDKNDHEKSTLIFVSRQPKQIQVFCIALLASWMIRVCNAPLNIREVLKAIILKTWYKGVCREDMNDLWWGMNIGGSPWSAQVIPAVALLMRFIADLKKLGWKLLVTMRTSGVYPKSGERKDKKTGAIRRFNHCDVDTLYFYREIP